MQIDVPLDRPNEAERLRTAVYRFSEMKAAAPPLVEVRTDSGRLTGAVAFWSPEAADEFHSYWRTFRSERLSWGGFRDV
jgi:hypothetical protein